MSSDKWNKKWGVGPEIFNPQNAKKYGEWLGHRYRAAGLIWILVETVRWRLMSIVLGKGLAFSASGWGGDESIKAFRLNSNGHGDLGESNLVWQQHKAMPHIPSFLYLKPHL